MRYCLLSILTIITVNVMGQDNWNMRLRQDFQLADFAFYQEDYAYAERLLKTVYKADTTYGPVLYEYGTSLLMLNRDRSRAENLLKRAVESGETEALFWYAESLNRSGQSEKALQYYEKYKVIKDKDIIDSEVDRHIEMAKTSMALRQAPVDVEITNLGPVVNSAYKEYMPLITGDGQTLYFTSRRENELFKSLDGNKEYFEDIYSCSLEDGEWSEPKLLDERINTSTHDATVAISGDGKTMLIYRANRTMTGGDLYITEMKYGYWKKPKKLNKNINSSYQEASACLSNDGSVIYFSSNRPGGYGGKDLYRARKLPNGEWSLAENLGRTINTPHDEDAPFVNTAGDVLYFSSNGHETMGGFDVFKCDINESYWSKPVNLGYPINTGEDEIYLTLDQSENKAYYASDKDNGEGQLDLYSIEFLYREEKTALAFGCVQNDKNEPVYATIIVYNADTQEMNGIYQCNKNTGKFMLALHPKTNYSLLIEAPNHEIRIDELYIDKAESEMIEYNLEPYYLTSTP